MTRVFSELGFGEMGHNRLYCQSQYHHLRHDHKVQSAKRPCSVHSNKNAISNNFTSSISEKGTPQHVRLAT